MTEKRGLAGHIERTKRNGKYICTKCGEKFNEIPPKVGNQCISAYYHEIVLKGYRCRWCGCYGGEDEINVLDTKIGERFKIPCPRCARYDRFMMDWEEIELTEDLITKRCMLGRTRHQWRHRKTRVEFNINQHGDEQCKWCRKTFREVTLAQKSVIKQTKRILQQP